MRAASVLHAGTHFEWSAWTAQMVTGFETFMTASCSGHQRQDNLMHSPAV